MTFITTPHRLNGETHTSCRKQRPVTTFRMMFIRTPQEHRNIIL